MKILELDQGSQEWIDARRNYFCASDAPVIMGSSKYKSRSTLIEEKNGFENLSDSFSKDFLFKRGHEAEKNAFKILESEKLIESKSLVGTRTIDGLDLLASFDAVFEDGAIFEHKLWNKELSRRVMECIVDKDKTLAPYYFWQLEHQLLVSEADEITFIVSDGTVEKRIMMDYFSVAERREMLLEGWKLFKKSMEEFKIEKESSKSVIINSDIVPKEFSCNVNNSMVTSNLPDYLDTIIELKNNELSKELKNEEDFARCENIGKDAKKARLNLKNSVQEVQNNFHSLSEFLKVNIKIDKALQELQSHCEKSVKENKEKFKRELVNDNLIKLEMHCLEFKQYNKNNWNTELEEFIKDTLDNSSKLFYDSMKNKKTKNSCINSVNEVLIKTECEFSSLANKMIENNKNNNITSKINNARSKGLISDEDVVIMIEIREDKLKSFYDFLRNETDAEIYEDNNTVKITEFRDKVISKDRVDYIENI